MSIVELVGTPGRVSENVSLATALGAAVCCEPAPRGAARRRQSDKGTAARPRIERRIEADVRVAVNGERSPDRGLPASFLLRDERLLQLREMGDRPLVVAGAHAADLARKTQTGRPQRFADR